MSEGHEDWRGMETTSQARHGEVGRDSDRHKGCSEVAPKNTRERNTEGGANRNREEVRDFCETNTHQELDVLHVHARRLPHLNHVLTDDADLLQVPVHLHGTEHSPRSKRTQVHTATMRAKL